MMLHVVFESSKRIVGYPSQSSEIFGQLRERSEMVGSSSKTFDNFRKSSEH